MSDQPPSDVLGALPSRRPQRRSNKRASAATADSASAGTPDSASAATPDSTPTNARARTTRPKQTARSKGERKAAASERKPSPSERTPSPPEDRPSPPPATPRRRPERLRQPAQPPGIPTMPRGRRPVQSNAGHILGTAAQAAAELAEIGVAVGVRALRNAVSRLPRP